MKTRVIISLIFAGLGLIIAAVPQNTTLPYKLTASEMLEQANNRMNFYSPEEVADMLVNKRTDFQLIDVRPPSEFEKFSLPNAINIPLTDILSEEYLDLLNQDFRRNILYSNGTTDATKAWMIMSQLGWNNNYVMEGGLNYWAEVIMNPFPPVSVESNEEIARYQFRKAAGKALNGDAAVMEESSNPSPIAKPPIQRKAKKKRVEGGC